MFPIFKIKKYIVGVKAALLEWTFFGFQNSEVMMPILNLKMKLCKGTCEMVEN